MHTHAPTFERSRSLGRISNSAKGQTVISTEPGCAQGATLMSFVGSNRQDDGRSKGRPEAAALAENLEQGMTTSSYAAGPCLQSSCQTARRRPAHPYVFAILTVVLTLPIKLLINGLIPQAPSTITFLCPVIIAAWYGGLRSGLLTVILSAPICFYFFLPSQGSITIAFANDGVRFALFLIEGTLISALSGSLQTAKERAQARAVELHLQQEALRQSEQRFRLVTESVQEYAITSLDPAGIIISGNAGTENIKGYGRDEIIGRHFSCYFADEDVQSGQPEHELEVAAREGRAKVEGWRVRKDGSRFWAEVVITAPRDGDGNLIGFSKVTRDLTERLHAVESLRQAHDQLENRVRERTSELAEANRALLDQVTERNRMQEALAREREFLVAVLQNINDGVVACDAEGVITLFNRATEELHKLPAAPITADQWSEHYNLYRPDAMTPMPKEEIALYRALQGEVVHDFELVIIPKGGSARTMLSDGQPLFDAQGKKLGAVVVMHEITERKRAEEHIQALNTRLEHRLQRLGVLRRIDLAINACLDVRVTLATLVDLITPQLHVDAVDILLLDPYTHRLEYAQGRGFRESEITRTSLRLGEGLAGRAAIERRPVSGMPGEIDWGSSRTAALEREGFVAYYAVPLLAKGQVKGVLEVFHRSPMEPDAEWLDYVNTLGGQAAIAIESASTFNQLQRSNDELVLAYDSTIEGWSRALDLRDKETEWHSHRVSEMTVRLARRMGISGSELTNLYRGALLHDIGKMGIPDTILLKPGPLNSDEWQVMRRHPEYANDLLSPIPYLRPALDIPYCHHEKWDGTGYPRGLRGEQIPRAARLFTVVDIWDALLSDRPYRKGWQEERVIDHLRSLSGTHLDPEALDAFLQMLATDEGRLDGMPRDQRYDGWGRGQQTDDKHSREQGGRNATPANGVTRPGTEELSWGPSGSPDSHASDDHADAAERSLQNNTSLRTLIAGVQDHATDLLLRRTLQGSGHEVTSADSGEQAWLLVQKDHFHVVIADWRMPELDGPELCRRIRSQVGTPYSYIILIATQAEQRDRLEALVSGADDLLVKPLDPRDLTARLEVARRILARQEELEQANARLLQQASVDDLTGLKNRRHLRETLEAAFSYAVRDDHPLSVVMVDVDWFKRFNDSFGHPAGDQLLRAIAAAICAEIRPHDVAARIGGDEFAVILPAADRQAAEAIAERLRITVADRASLLRPVTVSLGVATLSPSTTTATQLIEEADKALYDSKQAGRNRVTHYETLASPSTQRLAIGA